MTITEINTKADAMKLYKAERDKNRELEKKCKVLEEENYRMRVILTKEKAELPKGFDAFFPNLKNLKK